MEVVEVLAPPAAPEDLNPPAQREAGEATLPHTRPGVSIPRPRVPTASSFCVTNSRPAPAREWTPEDASGPGKGTL